VNAASDSGVARDTGHQAGQLVPYPGRGFEEIRSVEVWEHHRSLRPELQASGLTIDLIVPRVCSAQRLAGCRFPGGMHRTHAIACYQCRESLASACEQCKESHVVARSGACLWHDMIDSVALHQDLASRVLGISGGVCGSSLRKPAIVGAAIAAAVPG